MAKSEYPGIGRLAYVLLTILLYPLLLLGWFAALWVAASQTVGQGSDSLNSLWHLISIPVTNTSVNPARSLAPAIFAGPEYLSQVWLFWVAPIIGAVIAGWFYSTVMSDNHKPELISETVAEQPTVTTQR